MLFRKRDGGRRSAVRAVRECGVCGADWLRRLDT